MNEWDVDIEDDSTTSTIKVNTLMPSRRVGTG